MMHRLFAPFAVALAWLLPWPAVAQADYPAKAITIVVPSAALLTISFMMPCLPTHS